MRFDAGTTQSLNTSSVQAVAVNAEFFLFLADAESARAFLNDQRRDSLLAFFRLRIHIHDRCICRAPVRDPRLRSVDYVRIALANGFRLKRRRIRARLRLGKRVAADFFAARKWHQKFLLLLFGAKTINRIAVERILHG